MPPVKIMRMMTSYGGIIRIRLKGRSSVTSSQPAPQAPLYLFVGLIIQLQSILRNWRFAQNQMLILVNMPELSAGKPPRGVRKFENQHRKTGLPTG